MVDVPHVVLPEEEVYVQGKVFGAKARPHEDTVHPAGPSRTCVPKLLCATVCNDWSSQTAFHLSIKLGHLLQTLGTSYGQNQPPSLCFST